jgi:hypothetical protein
MTIPPKNPGHKTKPALCFRDGPDCQFVTENTVRLVFRAESAHRIDDQAYQQNQAKPSSADCRTAKVKTASAEQKKKHKDK